MFIIIIVFFYDGNFGVLRVGRVIYGLVLNVLEIHHILRKVLEYFLVFNYGRFINFDLIFKKF